MMAQQAAVSTCALLILTFAVLGFKRFATDFPSNLESIQQSAECFESHIQNYYPGNMEKMWDRFAYIVNKCSPLFRDTRLAEFPNTDELKYHFMPIAKLPNCSIISLGIGKDVKAEKRMKYALPDCEFFGADPVTEDNEELFSEVGNFYNLAVGDKNGSFRSYVLEEIYRYQEVPYIDLATFIREKVKQRTVDQLMMDIEHAEYPVLPFFDHRGLLDQWAISICQINIEIHAPDAENLQKFATFLERNFLSHQWIFINAEIHPILRHIRLFMANGRSEECVRRYFRNSEIQ